MLGRLAESRAGRAGIHDDGPTVHRAWRHIRVFRTPELALEGQFLVFGTQTLHDRRELVRHDVPEIVFDWCETEPAELALAIAGDHVNAPATATDVIEC